MPKNALERHSPAYGLDGPGPGIMRGNSPIDMWL